jgi:hypothetical protein
MTLELEKLTAEIEEMVVSASNGQQARQRLLDEALDKMHASATDWERIENCLMLALERVDRKKYRSARPLDKNEPLNAAVAPGRSPREATIVATDGSQILPDRHAAFLYSLINVGVFVYFHGLAVAPRQFTRPVLDYPGKTDDSDGRFIENGAIVNLRRDRAEIEVLARESWELGKQGGLLLAILDQRLLYWPAVGTGDTKGEGERILQSWQTAMTTIREGGGMLAGYIANPGKRSVITLLNTLNIEEPDFDLDTLTARDSAIRLTDTALFSRILGPGQRSKVFVDVSAHNDAFREHDALNEVCFFYLNPGRAGRQIARVDLPIEIARDADALQAVHALVYDQCQILGDYPYALARADEIAVVGRRDQESLNTMIEHMMQRGGLDGSVTAKQEAKNIARAGRTRHGV